MKIINNEYLAFFGYNDYPSNFYKCQIKFTFDKHLLNFNDSETIFMLWKAFYFNDIETANKIWMSESPSESKRLGRLVKPYVNDRWVKVRKQIMFEVIKLKFSFGKDIEFPFTPLRDKLQNHLDLYFVEASPYDKVWGIGINEENENVGDPIKWRGDNLLGDCFNELKSVLSDPVEDGENVKKHFPMLHSIHKLDKCFRV